MKKKNISIDNNMYSVDVADTFFTRMRGLLLTKGLSRNGGLLLSPCKSVHGFFMMYTIDVVFLDKNGKVLFVETLEPWHVSKTINNATMVLELRKGEGAHFTVNDNVNIEE